MDFLIGLGQICQALWIIILSGFSKKGSVCALTGVNLQHPSCVGFNMQDWDLVCCMSCSTGPSTCCIPSTYQLYPACCMCSGDFTLLTCETMLKDVPNLLGMCGSLVPVPCSCTRFTGLLELVTLWPVLFPGGVVQNTSSLVRHLDI